MKTRSNTFIPERETAWESCGEGLCRQIMGYDPHLMVVKVAFGLSITSTVLSSSLS